MSDLKVIYQDVGALVPRARNPRTHSDKQLDQIANSIRTFGFTNPILVDADNRIIAGHGRLQAAKRLNLKQVPTLRFDYMTAAQVRAYVIADNKLAENAAWDRDILALELKELSLELNIDLTVTGFETTEIDLLIDDLNASDDIDEIPSIDPDAPIVSRIGDVWQLGSHRLMCADALEEDSYVALLGGEKAQLTFSDFPYNVAIDGNVSGLGKNKHREFAMASGEMTSEEFIRFLTVAFQHLANFSTDGSIHFCCMDWRHIFEVMSASRGVYKEFKNLCVWSKTNAGMGSLYRSQHELVFVFKNGTAPHCNNVVLGKHGRYRTNVWTYAGANSFGAERDEALAMHPTVKPVALVADAIKDCSDRTAIVLDAFSGSGTTLIAAQQTGRRGYGLEIDPVYVDTTIRRFEKTFGIKAVHAASSLTFAEMRAKRGTEGEKDHV